MDQEPEQLLEQLRQQVKAVKVTVDSRRYRANSGNNLKERARSDVSIAIRERRLVPRPCETCGFKDTEAHHDDYARTLDVRWLCKPCHNAHHRAQRTHCSNGHLWVPENIYVMPNKKRRYCRECRRLRNENREDRVSETKQLRKERGEAARLLNLAAPVLRQTGAVDLAESIDAFLGRSDQT